MTDKPAPGRSIDERKLDLEEKRLTLESSFARKWFPTLATGVIGLSAAVFGYMQKRASAEATERARIEAHSKNKRECGFQVVQMYFQRRELLPAQTDPRIKRFLKFQRALKYAASLDLSLRDDPKSGSRRRPLSATLDRFWPGAVLGRRSITECR